MSLDVDLMVTQPTSVYSGNITHNLGKMAGEVKLSNGLTLYDVLWRPDEHSLKYAKDIWRLLDEHSIQRMAGVHMRDWRNSCTNIVMHVSIILMLN
jgi:hypothetical protein